MKKIEIGKDDLEKIKSLELEILIELDRICKAYDIKYTLAYGTLIGAIRHRGFIPWDDDIDVFMLREDLLKLREICKTELNERFFYQNHETDKEYYYLFDKIRLNGTIFKETYLSKYNIHHGVYLDIFPVDKLPDDLREIKKQYRRYRIYRTVLNSKYLVLNARHGKKKLAALLIRIATFPFPKELFYRMAEKTAQQNNGKDSKYAGCFEDFYIGPESYYTELMDWDFENHKFNVPVHYDELLKKMYGDYMTMPQEKDRHAKHDIIELKIN